MNTQRIEQWVEQRMAQRIEGVDALRGVAMLWMTGFHFCFDLNHAGYLRLNLKGDPVWLWQRVCILGLFLLCAGAGQAIALHQGQSWQRFGWRWLQIAACAGLVSVGSMGMFPQSFIYFGVLHGMALMLVLVRLTAHWGVWLWPLGGVAIAMQYVAESTLFTSALGPFSLQLNGPWLNWLGLISIKPVTEDYVPLVPWLGVMWWGMAATQWLLARPGAYKNLAPAWKWLGKLGRWSLCYYMLHQPVLLGGLWLWAAVHKTA